MLRLPTFTYHRPKTAHDAVAIAVEHGKAAMYVAGGTDLYPNMKRRHQTPTQVISLQDVPGLHGVALPHFQLGDPPGQLAGHRAAVALDAPIGLDQPVRQGAAAGPLVPGPHTAGQHGQ